MKKFLEILRGRKFFWGILGIVPILLFASVYHAVPSELYLTEQTEYTLPLGGLYTVETREETAPAASEAAHAMIEPAEDGVLINTDHVGRYGVSVRFGFLPVKTVRVTVVPKRYVQPCGEPIGVKMYTDGLLVIRVADVRGEEGISAPAREAGIRKGDRILAVNGSAVRSGEEFSRRLNTIGKELTLTVLRGEAEFTCSVLPVRAKEDHRYKLGIWVRDSAAGIGTMTFYDAETGAFAALGHAITDTDTGDVMPIRKGLLQTCRILSVRKGEMGEAGELIGTLSDHVVGSVLLNSELGIYGRAEHPEAVSLQEPIEAATRTELCEGAAEVWADVDGGGVRRYRAEILRISGGNKVNNKGIVLQITDSELLEKTGGIVQGMSGSPIIQNGKLVGAVTHVFVNDPSKGYGILIENMLAEAETVLSHENVS